MDAALDFVNHLELAALGFVMASECAELVPAHGPCDWGMDPPVAGARRADASK